MSNLKPAPISLTASVTAKLTGDRPAYGKGVTRIPVETGLVDQARGGRAATDYMAQRQERLAAAVRFLKSRCILVDPTDRQSAIRRYRVSGISESVLAEGVIEHAVSLGMEVSPDG